MAKVNLPAIERFSGPRPLVFLVPSTRMMDAEGNGPGLAVRDSYHLLSRSLTHAGYATYRFAWGEPGKFSLPEVLAHYSAACREERVDSRKGVLIGIEEGADCLARDYYEVYAVNPPMAEILLSPRVHPIDFNNVTCPYLLLFGQEDPQFKVVPYEQVKASIHHHQSRYGDLTTHFCFPQLRRDLGRVYLSEEVVDEIQAWLKRVLKNPSRPQEAAARGSAA